MSVMSDRWTEQDFTEILDFIREQQQFEADTIAMRSTRKVTDIWEQIVHEEFALIDASPTLDGARDALRAMARPYEGRHGFQDKWRIDL